MHHLEHAARLAAMDAQFDMGNLTIEEYCGAGAIADDWTIGQADRHGIDFAISGDLIARLRALEAGRLPEFPNFTNRTTIDARDVKFRTRRH